ncbi:MAG: MBL fold metallo-hydrolase [Arcicella sp.]|jgi:metallo-beta-lactamase family protein|nr:MBL fold metallo-hydrolase [Arcicella sp.]
MKIQFHGAAQRVTGSKHLIITEKGTKVLLDCGLFQGLNTQELNQNFAFDPSEIDFLILSHAHIDHTGLLPRLVKKGYKGNIFCTAATKDLCSILLGDSARIQESDLARINKRRAKRGEPILENLYSQEDVEQTLSQMVAINFREEFWLNDEISCFFTDTGHILGSAAVSLKIRENGKEHKVFFSGDIGRPNDKILKSPEAFPQADYVICESTYGARLHETEADVKAHLLQIVQKVCVEQQGKLLIPAFSIDRTQELVYALDQLEDEGKLPRIKVFVDSPLSVNATQIMKNHPECFNPEVLSYLQQGDGDAFGFPNLFYVSSTEDSKKLNELAEPCVIISSSGMAEAGRIKHHIANHIEDIRCAVLLVGYTSQDSLGGQLKAGMKKVNIFGKEFDVRAEVIVMDSFSAHADYQEIIQYLACQDKSKIKQLFLVHGEIDVQTIFKTKLENEGYQNVYIPAHQEEVILN